MIKKYLDYSTPVNFCTLDGLPYWREKLLLAFLFVIVRITIIAYVPSMFFAVYYEMWSIAILDTFVYVVIIFIYFKKSLAYKSKTIVMLVLLYLLAIGLLLKVGENGAGYLWLFFIPVVAAVLLDRNGAIVFVIVNILFLFLFGAFRYYYPNAIPYSGEFSIEIWIIITANFVALNLFTVFAIVLLTNGLSNTLKREIEVHRNLEEQAGELVKAKERAEKADRLKTAFLAQISHEFRTPVNTVLSFTTLLKEDVNENKLDDLESYFKAIEKGGIRILRTVELVIDMAELQAGTFEADFKLIDLRGQILDPVFQQLKTMADNQNVKLNYLSEFSGEAVVLADKYTMERIFIHLMDNAIKYSPNGEVTLTLKENDSSYIVEVADNGIGISVDYLTELFEPFSQEEYGYGRKFEGTGLGLPIVKRYCTINNADISVKSAKGKGSRFTVTVQKFMGDE